MTCTGSMCRFFKKTKIEVASCSILYLIIRYYIHDYFMCGLGGSWHGRSTCICYVDLIWVSAEVLPRFRRFHGRSLRKHGAAKAPLRCHYH